VSRSPLTDEQKAAQEALQTAVERHIAAYRDGDTGVVADWILVTSTAGFGDRGQGTSAYYLAFMGGEMAEHRAIGLLDWGKHMLKAGLLVGDEDD
jgi:hypothetical protein